MKYITRSNDSNMNDPLPIFPNINSVESEEHPDDNGIYILGLEYGNIQGFQVIFNNKPSKIEGCDYITASDYGRSIGFKFDNSTGLYINKLGSDAGVDITFRRCISISLKPSDGAVIQLFSEENNIFTLSEKNLQNLSVFSIDNVTFDNLSPSGCSVEITENSGLQIFNLYLNPKLT